MLRIKGQTFSLAFLWKKFRKSPIKILASLHANLGFAKSRPAKAQRPGSQQPTTARGPVLIFHSFLSSGKSTHMDMQRFASGLGVQHGRHEFVYRHLIIWIVWQYTSFLSGSVNRRINREWRFSLNKKQRKKGSKRIQMIKMVTETLTLTHSRQFCTQTRCRSVHARGFTAGQKKLWKIRTGPPKPVGWRARL